MKILVDDNDNASQWLQWWKYFTMIMMMTMITMILPGHVWLSFHTWGASNHHAKVNSISPFKFLLNLEIGSIWDKTICRKFQGSHHTNVVQIRSNFGGINIQSCLLVSFSFEQLWSIILSRLLWFALNSFQQHSDELCSGCDQLLQFSSNFLFPIIPLILKFSSNFLFLLQNFWSINVKFPSNFLFFFKISDQLFSERASWPEWRNNLKGRWENFSNNTSYQNIKISPRTRTSEFWSWLR